MTYQMQLNDGRVMPQLGLGLMRFGSESETELALDRGVAAGYRLFDTAAIYGNEREVGAALVKHAAIRPELFITTKLWNDHHEGDVPLQAGADSLARLGLDYIDLYLIHWPTPVYDSYLNAWEKLIRLRESGVVRSIGVSNFTPAHIERLIRETGVTPAVNQIEMHPHFQQAELREFHRSHGIVTQAWSPFGGGASGAARILDDPILTSIAARHQRTPAQVVLRWIIEQGASVIPKATSALHLRQNMDALTFALDEQDHAAIATMDRSDGRQGSDPETMRLRNVRRID
jgi:2,5-diketo-D-gluconate reductase A